MVVDTVRKPNVQKIHVLMSLGIIRHIFGNEGARFGI